MNPKEWAWGRLDQKVVSDDQFEEGIDIEYFKVSGEEILSMGKGRTLRSLGENPRVES